MGYGRHKDSRIRNLEIMKNQIQNFKKVIYTQRVEIVEDYGERRDCADQNISRFIETSGYLPIPVPNVLGRLKEWVEAVSPAGIVLTGGNSLVKYGGNAPERDATDGHLLEIAMQEKIPIYGFCRGMQSVLEHFGCELVQIENHVAVRHPVNGAWGESVVNSYHNQACLQVKRPLVVTERAEDGVIEAVECRELCLAATMWHPEREEHFAQSDVARLQQLFG